MGFRYRKSINLGGGFRVNISKSGVGYSYGTKGYRITKTSKGTIRKTVSIPGTGISYVDETSKCKEKIKGDSEIENNFSNNNYDVQNIANNVTSDTVSDGLQNIISLTKRLLLLNNIVNFIVIIGSISTLAIVLFNKILAISIWGTSIFIYFIFKIFGNVKLEYEIDEDQKEIVKQRLEFMSKIMTCNKVWRIIQSSKIEDSRYSGGATNNFVRIPCKVSNLAPFPFKVNVKVACFQSDKEILLFLPDKLFIIQGGNVGAINYSDISISTSSDVYIENEGVPNDAKIVDTTWKYVNKSGLPDKRFKDNVQLPICKYGKIELKSDLGLNTIIVFSNPDIIDSNEEKDI